MFGGDNLLKGPGIRCFTCLEVMNDFKELEEHHIKVHGCHPENAPIPKWTKWRKLKVEFMDWQWCKQYKKEMKKKNGWEVSYIPLWKRILVGIFS